MFTRQQFGTSQRRVIFFVGGYQTKISMYRPLYWIMRVLGYRVYAYVLDPAIVVAAHITAYVEQVQAVQQDIAASLADLPKDVPAYTMGNSLGSEAALYALKHTPQIRATVLVTVRGAIAEYIWNTAAGSVFKPAYIQSGYDARQLGNELRSVEPTSDLAKLGSRPVHIYYSGTDRVIPAANTKLLIDALDKAGAPHAITRYHRGSHLVATIRGLGAFWRWHKFFTKS